jgi:hypothetical protein
MARLQERLEGPRSVSSAIASRAQRHAARAALKIAVASPTTILVVVVDFDRDEGSLDLRRIEAPRLERYLTVL